MKLNSIAGKLRVVFLTEKVLSSVADFNYKYTDHFTHSFCAKVPYLRSFIVLPENFQYFTFHRITGME